MVADRARVPPWSLDDAPSWWVERLQIAIGSENRAENERRIRDARRSKAQGAAGRR